MKFLILCAVIASCGAGQPPPLPSQLVVVLASRQYPAVDLWVDGKLGAWIPSDTGEDWREACAFYDSAIKHFQVAPGLHTLDTTYWPRRVAVVERGGCTVEVL